MSVFTKWTKKIPIRQSTVNRIIGRGGGRSATYGAKIVRNLAKKLQKPSADP